MVKTALSTYDDVDLILFVIDARQKFCEEDEFVLKSLIKTQAPKLLIVNKIDLIPKPEILELIHTLHDRDNFKAIIPVSALKKDGLDILSNAILEHLPEGPEYYPFGTVTDCPEKFILAEMIREKFVRTTHMELPHSVAVEVDSFYEGKRGMNVVEATVFCEKESHKKILIGNKGSRLKNIGTLAREEIEKRFGSKVYLNLFVKLKKNWRTNDAYLKELGYTHDSY